MRSWRDDLAVFDSGDDSDRVRGVAGRHVADSALVRRHDAKNRVGGGDLARRPLSTANLAVDPVALHAIRIEPEDRRVEPLTKLVIFRKVDGNGLGAVWPLGWRTFAEKPYATLRKKADEDDRRAALAARRAVHVLRTGTLKMSARDAARLLGLSHQRVHQLTQEEGNR